MTDEIDEPLWTDYFFYRGVIDEFAQFIPFQPEAGLGGVERLELRENARVVEGYIQRINEF
jgi:hypothetical protein